MTRLLQIYFVLIILPIVVVASHQLLQEKESGRKACILSELNPIVYWASWWSFFLLLSVAFGVVLGVAFGRWPFTMRASGSSWSSSSWLV